MNDPDKVIDKYIDCETSLKIFRRTYDDEEPIQHYVVIEGNKESLEFLGELLIAQARTQSDCLFSISPVGAGCAYFADGSDIGISIHRIPCEHGKL